MSVFHGSIGDFVPDVEKKQELLDRAKRNILQAQQKQKEAYDKKHFNPPVYEIGSLVLKKDFQRKKRKGGKLDTKWVGPYKIVASLGRGLFRLENCLTGEIVQRVNGVHIKRYNVSHV